MAFKNDRQRKAVMSKLNKIELYNKRLGYVFRPTKVIDGNTYLLFDVIDTQDKQQVYDFKNQIMPLVKDRYNHYKFFIKGSAKGIYVR